MQQKSYSLRWRIIALVGVPVVVSGLAIGALALYTSWHEIEEIYDAQLIHAANVLHQLTRHELKEHETGEFDLMPETEDLGYKYEQSTAFRIWRAGVPVIRSSNAVAFDDPQAPPGLSDHDVGGEKWRFFVFVEPQSRITVETSERYEIRYELIWYLLLGLLLPASLFIPVVLLVVWYGASRGLRPLAYLSRDVDSRDSDDLRSIDPKRTPREIDSLVNALNRLFSRLEEALDRERDFTDNAAHELRTPLAAIKTQAQALRPRLQTMPDCSESLANLLASVDRATHLVDKLLAFSRLQKEQPHDEIIDLPLLLRDAVAELAADAVARDQTLSVSVDADGSGTVRGNRHALGIMVRNLMENAINHTPPGGSISVALTGHDTGPSIVVQDTGPGIADAEKERVLGRFYRIAGGDRPGSGLGLAIVKWIVEQHHAELSLSDVKPSGLCCTVTFPVPG